MSTYVVAVSGGVDSIVLLDALRTNRLVAGQTAWGNRTPGTIIVAHFDHGIRDDSADDARFVEEYANRHNLRYESRRVELGKQASEEMARTHRYTFLREMCKRHHATLVTAHHADDVIETIAINLTRGTGWRGLAVMAAPDIWRPFLGTTKQEIREYAAEYDIEWHEDSTNTDQRYLRNRIRSQLASLPSDVCWQLIALRARQAELAHEIDRLTETFAGSMPYSRYFFGHCGDGAADEILKRVLVRETGNSQTPPTRSRLLHAIKTARHGARVPIAGNAMMVFTARDFIVEMT